MRTHYVKPLRVDYRSQAQEVPTLSYIDRASIKGLTVFRDFLVKMNREQKEKQIRKEAAATLILFAVCFVWNVGFAYGLSGTGLRVFGLPLWWLVSTPGMFVIALAGVAFLLKKVFRDFSLTDEKGDGDE